MANKDQSPDRPACSGLVASMAEENDCPTCGHRADSHTRDRKCDVCCVIEAINA